jgi:transcriptional regulator with XRE-family HTH domain
MSNDSAKTLPVAFGKVLGRFRVRRNLTPEALALAAGLTNAGEVIRMERGHREPALSEFFRIAKVLGEPPALLFIDVIDAWRADPIQDSLYKARASDFARVYRLGYYEAPGDFRELQRTYGTFDGATVGAEKLNVERHRKWLKPIDTVCIYVRMGHVSFRWEPESAKLQPSGLVDGSGR